MVAARLAVPPRGACVRAEFYASQVSFLWKPVITSKWAALARDSSMPYAQVTAAALRNKA